MADVKLRNPRRKKGAKFQRKESPFPVPVQSITGKTCCNDRWFYYTGHFRDSCVVIEDPGDLVFLYRMGFFGKGNLSRSKPEHDVISNISQKAFSRSEKLRRLPPKERRIRQSKFREMRKERFRNHTQWKNEALVFTNRQLEGSTDNTQCFDECSQETSAFNIKEEDCHTDNNHDKNNDDNSNDIDSDDDVDDDDEIAEEGNDEEFNEIEEEEEQIKHNKDINEVIQDLLRSSGRTTKELEKSNDSKPSKATKKEDPYKVFEQLHLSLEEAFFLSYGLGSLNVHHGETSMTLTDMWQTFSRAQSTFLPRYVVYHYLRSKGWVPKTGMKYGTDFVIYKQGMPFYHSSYSVIVQLVENESLEISDCDAFTQRPLTWCSLCGLSRVNEHAAKVVTNFMHSLYCNEPKPRICVLFG